ncbi:MAG: efflux transporter outer membrane subunit [Alistipes sp.]|nr:efflux transporter outer membrane subunit [Alistipes sp.]
MKQVIIIISMLFIACTPRLQRVSIDIPAQYIYAINSDSINIEREWWKMFKDTTLNRLIATALSQNRDLKVAVSRIEEARANLTNVRSTYLPSLSFGRDIGVSGGDEVVQQYAIEPVVSWEIPLFGSLKQTTTMAKSNIAYAQWQYAGVELSLVSEVATTYFTLLQYRRNLDTAIRSAELRGQSAMLIDSLFVYGLASGVNREQAMNLLYTAQADVPMYERAIRQTLLSLDVLLGQNPDSTSYQNLSGDLITDYQPLDIPTGIPSDILHRRADVMSAWLELCTAASKAKMARIARFPTFSLSADGGLVSNKLSKLFSANSWAWSAILSITQPIYNFSAMKSREKIAIEQYNQALYSYYQRYLEAVEQVENALVAISTYREETTRYKNLLISNARIAAMTSALYNNGLSAYLDVIDAERTLYNSQMEYSNIVANQYINYINLCKALGGGYKNSDK